MMSAAARPAARPRRGRRPRRLQPLPARAGVGAGRRRPRAGFVITATPAAGQQAAAAAAAAAAAGAAPPPRAAAARELRAVGLFTQGGEGRFSLGAAARRVLSGRRRMRRAGRSARTDRVGDAAPAEATWRLPRRRGARLSTVGAREVRVASAAPTARRRSAARRHRGARERPRRPRRRGAHRREGDGDGARSCVLAGGCTWERTTLSARAARSPPRRRRRRGADARHHPGAARPPVAGGARAPTNRAHARAGVRWHDERPARADAQRRAEDDAKRATR